MSDFSFGMINTKTGMFHEGYLDDYRNQKFSEVGVPCQLPELLVPAPTTAPQIEADDELRGYIRAKGSSSYLRQVAFHLGCEMTITAVDKHWFSETAWFTAKGKVSKIARLKKQIDDDMNEYLR